MILSASRRTDIPAFYPEWFLRRLREGYACVRNPLNPLQVSRVTLTPDVLDCIVFWTKNPAPLLPYLAELAQKGIPFYFQFTLNAYGPAVEPGLPAQAALVETFRALSRTVGGERVVWRYDPVILSDRFTQSWHFAQFESLCRALRGYTQACVFSFADLYAKTVRRAGALVREMSSGEMLAAAGGLAAIAAVYGIALTACCEAVDFTAVGAGRASCVDKARIERIAQTPLTARKSPGRRGCGCVESVDIGAYDSCPNGCVYCYAVRSEEAARRGCARHNPRSPLLLGDLSPQDHVTERKVRSCKTEQLRLF